MPPNPWALAGLKRVEVRNAATLAGLWRSSIVGTAFLDAFLRRINVKERLPERTVLEQGYGVRIEDCPLGLASDRVDITIEGRRFLVGIEVKIGAGLGPRQLERYVETIRTRAGRDRRWAVVMLAPRPDTRPDVVPARWHDVAAAAEQIAEQFPADHHAWLVSQFGAHVGTF